MLARMITSHDDIHTPKKGDIFVINSETDDTFTYLLRKGVAQTRSKKDYQIEKIVDVATVPTFGYPMELGFYEDGRNPLTVNQTKEILSHFGLNKEVSFWDIHKEDSKSWLFKNESEWAYRSVETGYPTYKEYVTEIIIPKSLEGATWEEVSSEI